MNFISALTLLFLVTQPLSAEDPITNDCEDEETPGVEVTTESSTLADIDYADLVFMVGSCTSEDLQARIEERNLVAAREVMHNRGPRNVHDDKVLCKTGGKLYYETTFFCGTSPYLKRMTEEYNLIYENKNETPKYVEKERFERVLNHYQNTTKISRDDLIIPDGAEPLVIGARWMTVQWPWIGNISAIPMSEPYKDRRLLVVVGDSDIYSVTDVRFALDKAIPAVLGFSPQIITFMGGFREESYKRPGGKTYTGNFWSLAYLTDAHIAALLDFNIISGNKPGPPKVLSDEYFRKAEGLLREANVTTVDNIEVLPGTTPLWPVGVYFTTNENEFYPE